MISKCWRRLDYLADDVTEEVLAAPAGRGVEGVAGLAGAGCQVPGPVYLLHVKCSVIQGVCRIRSKLKSFYYFCYLVPLTP